jgi:TATA-box binding protein (TBP) (component of TFIID and TFIIIB)
LEDPTATFLLFSNGKLVCTGTKNKAQLDDSMIQLNKNVRAALKRIKELAKKKAADGDDDDF